MTWMASFDDRRAGFQVAVVAVVVLLHILIYLALDRAQGASAVAAGRAEAMRVTFVTRRPDPAPAPPPLPEKRPPRTELPARGPIVRAERRRAPAAAPAAIDPKPDRPLVLDWNVDRDPVDFPSAPDPAWAPGASAAEGPERIRMRRQISGRDVVEGAAQALGFWPEGYEADPCPRVQRNIGNLMTDARPTGRRALEEEVRRRRVACRQ